jgi:hypothetical protein
MVEDKEMKYRQEWICPFKEILTRLMPRLTFHTEADYSTFWGHELNTLTHHFCTEDVNISLQSASYLWHQFYVSSSGEYCFSRSQDYWGSWCHNRLFMSKPNWGGSPTGIPFPVCLLDVKVKDCLCAALRNTEFLPVKLVLRVCLFHFTSITG